MDQCLFCKIAKKEVDSKLLYEDEEIIAFLDIDQKIAGHTLVVPKKHITDFKELDQETLGKMFEVAKKIQPLLMNKLDKKAMTLSFNYGDSQIIKHVHLHLLPGFFEAQHEKNIDDIYRILKGD